MNRPAIPVNKKTQARLQRAYDDAVAVGAEVFIFDGNEILTAYAKYMLDFFATVLGPVEKKP